VFGLIGLFIASYIGVFFKAFQQLNVVHHKILWVIPVSFVMAACEVFLIWHVAKTLNLWAVIPIGLGAGLGCISSMFFHKHIREKTNETKKHDREGSKETAPQKRFNSDTTKARVPYAAGPRL
jgi:hypothetical protein